LPQIVHEGYDRPVFPRSASRRSGPLGDVAILGLAAAPALAQAPPPASSAGQVPLSPTSQCVEGPGAPPADPSKVTRVVPGQAAPAPPAEETYIDAPNAPAGVLLELGAHVGGSLRLDDGPGALVSRRAGYVLGGSLFLWPTRSLAFGASYSYVDLSRSRSAPDAIDAVTVDYSIHALIGEARAAPFRFSSGAVFAIVGLGPAWQTASLRATLPPLNGFPGGSFSCSTGSNAELAFRGGIGVKARFSRAAALLADLTFTGYRLAENLTECSVGAGAAQTLLLRAGITYDIDISSIVR
jgi:hypothetical protein